MSPCSRIGSVTPKAIVSIKHTTITTTGEAVEGSSNVCGMLPHIPHMCISDGSSHNRAATRATAGYLSPVLHNMWTQTPMHRPAAAHKPDHGRNKSKSNV